MFSGEIGHISRGIPVGTRGDPIVTSDLWAEPDDVWFEGEQPVAAQGVQAAHSGRHRRAYGKRSSYREVFVIGEF